MARHEHISHDAIVSPVSNAPTQSATRQSNCQTTIEAADRPKPSFVCDLRNGCSIIRDLYGEKAASSHLTISANPHLAEALCQAGLERHGSDAIQMALAIQDARNEPPTTCTCVNCKSEEERISFSLAAATYAAAGGESRYLAPIVDFFADATVDTIGQAQIDVAAEAICSNKSPSTRNRRVYGPLSAVLKFSARQGWCERLRIRRPRHAQPCLPVPSQEELDAFLKAAGPSLRRAALLILSVEVTIREALTVEWHQVDLARRCIRLPANRNTSRRITISPEIAEMLARFPHKTGRVLRTPNGAPYAVKDFTGGLMRTACAEACKRAGVAGITLGTVVRTRKHRKKVSEADVAGSKSND